MNQRNFEFLDDQVYYTGFGDTLSGPLKDAISKGRSSFSIPFQKVIDNEVVDVSLNFRKSKTGDLYFFNSYDMVIKNGDKEKVQSQNFRVDSTFYRNPDGSPVNKRPTITFKEAYNLMSGRAVRKDMVEKIDDGYQWRNAWLQLNFKVADKRGNFERQEFPEYDMIAHLKQLPIKELEIPDYASNLVDSVERGNRQSVTMMAGENEQLGYIEAAPRYDNLFVFDEAMKRVNTEVSQTVTAPETHLNENVPGHASEHLTYGSNQPMSQSDNTPSDKEDISRIQDQAVRNSETNSNSVRPGNQPAAEKKNKSSVRQQSERNTTQRQKTGGAKKMKV